MQERAFSAGGANLYAFTNPCLNSFCLALYVRAGALYESADDSGITHMLEHMVFRNLKKKYDGRFYDLLALNGIDFSGSTYKEFLCFTAEGLVSGFDFAAEIMCGIFSDINISSSEFNFERSRIKAEIREKDERHSLDYLYNKAVWEGTNNDKTILGYCKVLDRISLKRLNAYRDRIFSKDNFFFYVTGNVSDDKIEELNGKISKLNIDHNALNCQNEICAPDSFFHRDGVVRVKEGRPCYIQIGFDVDVSKYSGAVHDLIYAILFKGDNSLIFDYLSEEDPLIYSFDSTYEQYDNVGNIYFGFDIEQNKIEEAVGRVVRVLNDLKAGNFNFDANLCAEISDWKIQLDNPSGLNWDMAYYNHILKTDRIDYSREDLGRYKGVTKEQIMRAASEIFRKNNLTVAVKGAKRRIKAAQIESIIDGL